MKLQDYIDHYKLNKEDVWECHGSWILKHDAITKIAKKENIRINKIESLYQSETSCRFLITMGKWVDDTCIEIITTVGEADNKNSKNNYYGSMAEKRGIDRGVLKLLNLYEEGFYSEIEADDFKKATKKQIDYLTKESIKIGFDNSHWDLENLSNTQAQEYFAELNSFKKNNKEKK